MRQIFISVFALSIALSGCQSSNQKSGLPDNQYASKEDRPLVDNKYSLASDRKALEDLRKDIPAEKKQDNDELSLVLQWTQKGDTAPSKIREQWQQLTRKKRETFDRDMKKEREAFNRTERKSREEFLNVQKAQREEFKRQKTNREQSNTFYKDQTQARSDFFAGEREKRGDFESDTRERRKSFEDYMKEKNNMMNDEMRNYTKKYDALKKEKKQNEPSSRTGDTFQVPVASFMESLQEELDRELEAARNHQGTALEAGE
jgi:hypothetical protein